MKNKSLLLAFVAAALLPFGCTKESSVLLSDQSGDSNGIADDRAAAPNINGQSIQVNSDINQQDFQIEETETWSYDWSGKPAAVAAFPTYFTFTTSGGPNASQIETAKHNAMLDNKCNFWHGNPLAVSTSAFGARSVTCTPIAPGQYAAKTGWSVVIGGGGTVDVNLSNIFVASASYLKKAKASGGWSKKYSYTMTDGAGSRLTSLTVELLHDDVVIETRPLDPLLIPIEYNADWAYTSQGNYYGDAGAVPALTDAEGQTVNYSQANFTHDDFNGNNGTGGSRALVGNQDFPGLTLEGNYSVRLSGVIKSNGFVADQSFSIVRTVITTGGCN